jgi:mannose/fructose/N-acetylgalactosamine-specific phosphotransferase system component IIC
MAVIDDLVMLAMVVAVVAVGILGVMLALYIWALKRRRQLDEEEAGKDPVEYPPDGHYEL